MAKYREYATGAFEKFSYIPQRKPVPLQTHRLFQTMGGLFSATGATHLCWAPGHSGLPEQQVTRGWSASPSESPPPQLSGGRCAELTGRQAQAHGNVHPPLPSGVHTGSLCICTVRTRSSRREAFRGSSRCILVTVTSDQSVSSSNMYRFSPQVLSITLVYS